MAKRIRIRKAGKINKRFIYAQWSDFVKDLINSAGADYEIIVDKDALLIEGGE